MIFLPGRRSTTTSASGSVRATGSTFTTGCARARAGRQKKTSPTAAILDSQSVKTAEQGGVSGYDAGKKIKGRKRHLLVDTLGLLLGVCVTSAAVQDRDGARELLRKVWFIFGRLQVIWADGGYAGQLLGWVKALRPWGKLHLEIVKRSDTAKGFALVRKRWIVERTFAWLYQRRRLVRDYERRTDHSEAFIYIAMIGLMTKRLARATL